LPHPKTLFDACTTPENFPSEQESDHHNGYDSDNLYGQTHLMMINFGCKDRKKSQKSAIFREKDAVFMLRLEENA